MFLCADTRPCVCGVVYASLKHMGRPKICFVFSLSLSSKRANCATFALCSFYVAPLQKVAIVRPGSTGVWPTAGSVVIKAASGNLIGSITITIQ